MSAGALVWVESGAPPPGPLELLDTWPKSTSDVMFGLQTQVGHDRQHPSPLFSGTICFGPVSQL